MDLDQQTWWYVSRATGFVGWALLAASVLWGLFITNKTLSRRTPPAWVLDLHRHLGGLALAFVAVHLAVLPLDTYTDWGWADLFVPMASRWKPGPTAFGVVALYLLVAVELSSLLGRRIPRTWWRRLHFLSFPLYVVATIHLFTAGTDSENLVAVATVAVASTLIAALTATRALGASRTPAARIPASARVALAPGSFPVPATMRAPDAVLTPTLGVMGDLLPPSSPTGTAPAVRPSTPSVATLERAHGVRRPNVDERAARIHRAALAARARADG